MQLQAGSLNPSAGWVSRVSRSLSGPVPGCGRGVSPLSSGRHPLRPPGCLLGSSSFRRTCPLSSQPWRVRGPRDTHSGKGQSSWLTQPPPFPRPSGWLHSCWAGLRSPHLLCHQPSWDICSQFLPSTSLREGAGSLPVGKPLCEMSYHF